jgi:hypothetical protein
MKALFPLLVASLLLPLQAAPAQVEEVARGTKDAPILPEDLFALPPGSWSFARQLWNGTEPCTADQCEGGYTSGDLVVSVERNKNYVRTVAGFRSCESVSWNEFDIGKKASGRDTKTLAKRIKRTVAAAAKYCKLPAPAVATLDAARLYPAPPAATQ